VVEGLVPAIDPELYYRQKLIFLYKMVEELVLAIDSIPE
jgi:hypothetical protein